MGKWEETQEAYHGQEPAPEEKVIPERDKMGLVQALTILHRLRDTYESCEDIRDAFNVVFEWIDNAVILFAKFGGH